MSYDRPPYWFWKFDRWKLLVTAVFAVLVILLPIIAYVNQPQPSESTEPVAVAAATETAVAAEKAGFTVEAPTAVTEQASPVPEKPGAEGEATTAPEAAEPGAEAPAEGEAAAPAEGQPAE